MMTVWLQNKEGYWLNPLYCGDQWFINFDAQYIEFVGTMSQPEAQLIVVDALKIPHDAFILYDECSAMRCMPSEADFFSAFCFKIMFQQRVDLANPHKYDLHSIRHPIGDALIYNAGVAQG